jgi:hypothetical protein
MTQTTDQRVEPDVVDLLIAQHMTIRDLFQQVAAAAGQARREPFERLVRLLAVHETAEEQVVHPLARTCVDGGDAIVDARLEEEHDAKVLLSQLEDVALDAPEFGELLERLRTAVLTHAHHEEAYEFRYLRRECQPSQLQTLTALVEAAEATAPTHPHPGVETATQNLTVGPLLAMFDRTRDLVLQAMGRDQA